MTVEETLAAVVAAKIEPLSAEVRRLAGEVAALRTALPPLLLTPKEAGRVLRMSASTVARRMRDGSLPARRIEGKVLVDIGAMQPPAAAEVVRLALEIRRSKTGEG